MREEEVQLVITLRGTVSQLQGLTFGCTMGPRTFIMPAGEEGDMHKYANTEESVISYGGENPD